MIPPKDSITITASTTVTHPQFHASPYKVNGSQDFIFHTAESDPHPEVRLAFDFTPPARSIFLYNRCGSQGISERLLGVEFAASSNGTTWRDIGVRITERQIHDREPICIALHEDERFLKIFRRNKGAPIHLSQVTVGEPLPDSDAGALTSTFAAEHKLPLDHKGRIQESINSGIQDAVYAVVRQGHGAHTSSAAKIKSLQIRFLGRFSNALLQLSNAVRIAHKLNANAIYLPTSHRARSMFPNGDFTLTPYTNLAVRLASPPDHETVLQGVFFHSEQHKNLFRESPTRYDAIQAFKKGLGFDYGTDDAFSKDELVVHIRSGDVFSGNPHQSYGQPPLAYYKLVIEKTNPSSVILVYENEQNPVIPALHAFLKSQSRPYRVQCSSWREDVGALLRATTLVSGRGTFISGITALSNNVKELYSFEENASWNPGTANLVVHDTCGEYRSEILAHNWRNTAEQRQMVISYPKSCMAFGKQPDTQT